MKDLDKAEKCFSTALEIDPGFSAAHVDLACVAHFRGDYEKAFTHYEERFAHFSQLNFYMEKYDQSKRWKGESLEDKTILLYGEQGLGDSIHFVRYVKKVKELGAHTIVHCPKSLCRILSRCEGVDGILDRNIVNDRGEEFPDYDYQCSMMSLPFLLKCFDDPLNDPYIKPLTTFDVKEKYHDTFNIGIMWAGSPAHPNDLYRSVHLNQFREIHSMPGVKLFNLQVDLRKRSYAKGSRKMVDLTKGCEDMKVVDMTTMIKDFEDTATIISGLDLLICVDTAIVHLAGAMDIPCWVLMPYNPDWRWGLEGKTTRWYKSLKLFRAEKDPIQSKAIASTTEDCWAETFQDIKKELENEIILQNKR